MTPSKLEEAVDKFTKARTLGNFCDRNGETDPSDELLFKELLRAARAWQKLSADYNIWLGDRFSSAQDFCDQVYEALQQYNSGAKDE